MQNLFTILLVSMFSMSLVFATEFKETKKNNSKVPFTKFSNPAFLDLEIPEDFPDITIDLVNNPTKGYIVMECFQVSTPDANYIMILDEEGKVVWYDKPANQGVDFKVQPNGRFSYATAVKLGDSYQAGPLRVQNIYVQHKILDEDKNIIDSVQMQNEFLADMHDFRILPNGNFLLIAYERYPIDMSRIIPGGNPNATIVVTVVQELDKDKNCVFQWRSTDHIPVLATKDDPRKATFEHVHGNSLFIDKDGNLISTFPTTFEIVKIDMVTGELVWRLGGDNNEFEIIGENEVDKPYYFRMQHDAKIIPNGNLLFYDNAVQKKSGWNSRAVEYELDEINKTAKLVWEYKHNPPISAFAMGSAQRLDNGNTLINWGLMFTGQRKGMTEVTPEGEKTFELTFPELNFSYRAQKIDIPLCQPAANVDKYEMLQGNTYLFNDNNEKTGVQIFFKELDAFMYNMMNVKRYLCAPKDPQFNGEAPLLLEGRYFLDAKMVYSLKADVSFDIGLLPSHQNPNDLVIFVRTKENEGIFEAITTSYNQSEKRLVGETTKFGEFVIGFVRQAEKIFPPRIMYPHNRRAFVNMDTVRIVWTATGRHDGFRIQIAEDNTFSNIVFDSTGLRSSVLYKGDFAGEKNYYWRVKSFYRELESDWSETGSFNFTNPYISMNYPAGGEILATDSTIIVRWNTNRRDTMVVKLFNGNNEVAVISEGIFSHFNAISWKIPSTLPEGNNYSIVVFDKKNPDFITESNAFTINNPTSVLEKHNIAHKAILQVSPNPANDYMQIGIELKEDDFVNVSIYDALGNKVKNVLNTDLMSGVYSIPLKTPEIPNGVYYCILQTNSYSISSKVIIIR